MICDRKKLLPNRLETFDSARLNWRNRTPEKIKKLLFRFYHSEVDK